MIDKLLNILLIRLTRIIWRRHCAKYEGVCCKCVFCYVTENDDHECVMHDAWAAGMQERQEQARALKKMEAGR